MITSRPVRLLTVAFSAAVLVSSTVTASAVPRTIEPGASGPATADAVGAAPEHRRPGPPPPRASAEARKVDRAPTPRPDWWDCGSIFGVGECATVELPLDYDRPRAATTSVALLRIPASDQENRIGTLFLNPGGPGGSGVETAAVATTFLGPEVLERFDVIGFDPRGTNYSSNVRCFRNAGEQAAALSGLAVRLPVTRAEQDAHVASATALGRACSTHGKPLSASMSTAQVARDLDVLRRMVGDDQLSYLGFSYGSYLGTVYANMFPERVRAVAVDGVVDPHAWVGTRDAHTPVFTRVGSGEASARTFDEILTRCADAGPQFCNLAGLGDPHTIFEQVADLLQESPLLIEVPELGLEVEVDYSLFMAVFLQLMYSPEAGALVDAELTWLYLLLQERAGETPGAEQVDLDAARRGLALKAQRLQGDVGRQAHAGGRAGADSGSNFPYDNWTEAQLAVLCTDGRHAPHTQMWPRLADAEQERAPRFGPLWAWITASCAERTWTARDSSAYSGPFTREPANPLLVVGNDWDPATPREGAEALAALQPGSRLLLSDNWGHTAYGTSACATGAIDAYLIDLELPDEGTVCAGDVQPFTTPLPQPGDPEVPSEPEMSTRSLGPEAADEPGVPDRLPPVVPPFPGSAPRQ
ncbi:alpha/beta hydrolase [Cellulomonas bogoriensis]|uniref:Transporter n=1 Tax=Cellulomonas bogoriensis 69B4 = DSM 16987 TaxID=1386082 RepID=A0A0A0BZT5_9CELL|nr:alpha/beta hydrolase [Cellulomonas bogoriensis]KGM13451.1 transporter [Cellulomonas bogoriensis 69B4 = DSM 16987]